MFTKEIPQNTKENIPSDHCYSHFLMEGRISLIPWPDCCIFVAVSKKKRIVHLGRHNGNMAIWPFGHYGVKWPYSNMAVMASKVAIMGVFGNSNANGACFLVNNPGGKKGGVKRRILCAKQILLSLFTGRSNQHNSFTRLRHLYCWFGRHPYWYHLTP